jgi:integrase
MFTPVQLLLLPYCCHVLPGAHSLRHTCATLLLSKNVNPKIVQEMLGHATISQTMDTYSHVMPGMSDIAAEAIESALS